MTQMQMRNEPKYWLEMIQINRLPGKQRVYYRWSAGLIFGMIGALLGSLISGPIEALFGGLVFGLLGVLLGKIEPVEAFTWSWKRTRSVLLYLTLSGLLAGLICGLIYELVVGLSIIQNQGLFFGLVYLFLIGLPEGLRIGLICGLFGGMAISVIYGFSSKRLTDHYTFFLNECMHRSTKNGLAGVLLGALIGFSVCLFFGSLTFVLVGMLIVGMICGLRAVIQYFILSFWLWRSFRTRVE